MTGIDSRWKKWVGWGCLALGLIGGGSHAVGAASEPPLIRHWDLQAVDAMGLSTWNGPLPFRIRGVILNNPEERLDPTPHFIPWNNGQGAFQLGGEWEIFIQAVDPDDRGGTACWMGQNYGNLPWLHDSALSYTDEQWEAEMNRLNYDPETGHRFRAGDLVEVLARRSLFYAGKRNINEAHDISPDANFEIRLIQADYGLPEPERVHLSQLVRPDDGNPETYEDIFDPTRQTGGEHYQGMLICLEDVEMVDASGWNKVAWEDRICRVTDGKGRYFPLRMPLRDMGPVPQGRFSVIGILDQEASGSDGRFGYELFVISIVPQLRMRVREDGKLELSWTRGGRYFGVEGTDDPVKGEWQLLDQKPELTDQGYRVVVEPSAPMRFFRLRWAGHGS